MQGGDISFKYRYRLTVARHSPQRGKQVLKLLAALLAGMRITTPLTTLLRKEPPPKGKPRKGGELKQTAIGSHSFAALLAGMRITTPLTALLRKEPPPKGKPRKDGELKQTAIGSLSFATLPKGESKGTAAFLPIKKSSPRKLRIRGEGKSRNYFVTFTFCSRCSASL